jgi:arylsulfatase A-like enzyme
MRPAVVLAPIRLSLKVIVCTVILAPGHLRAAQEDKPTGKAPNILFLLTDQHRWDCVGAYGAREIHTPHLDRIAKEGIRFDRMYTAQPVCSPNRAAIITGLYPHTNGVQENKVPLPKSSITLAEMLAPKGYDCGYFGKWHLGRRDAFATFPEYPDDGRGSNHYFGRGQDKRYAPDVIADDALAFMKKKRDRPFYIYVSFYPPHPPFSVPAGYEERYAEVKSDEERVYLAMCTKVDEQFGRLLDALDEIGQADHTLVIFTSEHGHNFERRWNNHHKRLCYDSSARIPLLMRMPGVIPAGQVTESLISSVDLVPTMLRLIGQPIPDDVEGRDLSDLARGKRNTGREYVFMENVPFPFKPDKGEERCVMDVQWKLILSTVRPPELIDYRHDPEEKTNLYAEMADSPVVNQLIRQLARWAERTDDELAPKLIRKLHS